MSLKFTHFKKADKKGKGNEREEARTEQGRKKWNEERGRSGKKGRERSLF